MVLQAAVRNPNFFVKCWENHSLFPTTQNLEKNFSWWAYITIEKTFLEARWDNVWIFVVQPSGKLFPVLIFFFFNKKCLTVRKVSFVVVNLLNLFWYLSGPMIIRKASKENTPSLYLLFLVLILFNVFTSLLNKLKKYKKM